MDLMAIRNKLVEIIGTATLLDGWTGFPYIIDEFPSPAFFITDPLEWVYGSTMSGGVDLVLPVRYCVSRADPKYAHEILSQIISTEAGTPFAVIDDNPSLGGVVDSATVRSLGRFSRYRTGGGASYLGAEQEIAIMAS